VRLKAVAYIYLRVDYCIRDPWTIFPLSNSPEISFPLWAWFLGAPSKLLVARGPASSLVSTKDYIVLDKGISIVGPKLGEGEGIGSYLYSRSWDFSKLVDSRVKLEVSSDARTSTTSVSRMQSLSKVSITYISSNSSVSISLSICSFKIAPISRSKGL
jgi:hypothetical protein